MLKRWRGGLILLALFLMIGHAVAQSRCSALVQDVLNRVVTACHEVSRNQACYGNIWIHAVPQPDVPAFTFEKVGDIVDVLHLDSLQLDPMDEAKAVWGLAMMRLQADIPETLPGQNVTFLLFGDVEIENRATAAQAPMQAFYLRSGVGDAACLEAPESGVLIQTPEGIKSVNFNINGVDLEIGSTVMLQAQPGGDFIIRTLEGTAVITVNGTSYPIIAGTQLRLPLDAQLQPAGTPSRPMPLSDINLKTVPIAPLPRQIPPPVPLSETTLMKLEMRLEAGLEPCGISELPGCDHALAPDADREWAIPGPSERDATPTSDMRVSTASFMGTLALAITPLPDAETTLQSPIDTPPLSPVPILETGSVIPGSGSEIPSTLLGTSVATLALAITPIPDAETTHQSAIGTLPLTQVPILATGSMIPGSGSEIPSSVPGTSMATTIVKQQSSDNRASQSVQANQPLITSTTTAD